MGNLVCFSTWKDRTQTFSSCCAGELCKYFLRCHVRHGQQFPTEQTHGRVQKSLEKVQKSLLSFYKAILDIFSTSVTDVTRWRQKLKGGS